jgi:hypothetical protein
MFEENKIPVPAATVSSPMIFFQGNIFSVKRRKLCIDSPGCRKVTLSRMKRFK